MRQRRCFLFSALLVILALAPQTPADTRLAGGMATLLAHDDLRSSFSFRNGAFGAQIQDGELRLDDAQLVFHTFGENLLSFGFVRNELVSVLDLGDLVAPGIERAADLAPKPPVSIFHTLFLDGVVFKYQGPLNQAHRLPEAQAIVSAIPPPGIFHIEPQIGHTYLLKAQRRAGHGDTRPQFFKFLVVDFEPGHRLTLRWGPLK